MSNLFEYVLFGLISPEANDPLFATIWWPTVSVFLHCTVSPPATVTVLGAKPVDLMFTVFVALNEATAKPAPARAHTAVAVSNALRIGGSP
jgi:hypothetical protein